MGEDVGADDRLCTRNGVGRMGHQSGQGSSRVEIDAGASVRRARQGDATSSSGALPARSPSPSTVTLAWLAPARIAASVLAVARPRSSWPWNSIGRSVSCSAAGYIRGRERIEHAERVGEAETEHAEFRRRAARSERHRELGPRGILAAQRHLQPLVARIADDAASRARRPRAAPLSALRASAGATSARKC